MAITCILHNSPHALNAESLNWHAMIAMDNMIGQTGALVKA